jgi:hypothetical protein
LDDVKVVAQTLGLKVDVTRWAALAKDREEDAAFEDEVLVVTGTGDAIEERFEDVELQQFLCRAALGTCEFLERCIDTR